MLSQEKTTRFLGGFFLAWIKDTTDCVFGDSNRHKPCSLAFRERFAGVASLKKQQSYGTPFADQLTH
jgi:hypothetical protein